MTASIDVIRGHPIQALEPKTPWEEVMAGIDSVSDAPAGPLGGGATRPRSSGLNPKKQSDRERFQNDDGDSRFQTVQVSQTYFVNPPHCSARMCHGHCD
jgi:hypothetical protein